MSKLLKQYHNLENAGSYGGVARVKASVLRKQKPFWKTIWDIRYTNRPDASFLPYLSNFFTIDEQWTADLIEVINISKQNKGYIYLLTMVRCIF